MNDVISLAAINDSLAIHGESLAHEDLVAMTPNRRAKVDRVRAMLVEGDELGAINRSLEAIGEEVGEGDLVPLTGIRFTRPNADRTAVLQAAYARVRPTFVSRSAVNRSLEAIGEEI